MVHPHPYFSLVMVPLPLNRDYFLARHEAWAAQVLGLLAAPPLAMLPAVYHLPLLPGFPAQSLVP